MEKNVRNLVGNLVDDWVGFRVGEAVKKTRAGVRVSVVNMTSTTTMVGDAVIITGDNVGMEVGLAVITGAGVEAIIV